MKDLFNIITNELLKFKELNFQNDEKLLKNVVEAIIDRVSKEDSETVIINKVFNVLNYFFYENQSFIERKSKKDYQLLAKRIKLAFDEYPDDIKDLLEKITDLATSFESEKKRYHKKMIDLHKNQVNYIIKLQSICSHEKYVEQREKFRDEYGFYDGSLLRKCIVCCLTENGGQNDKFSKITGTRVYPRDKRFEDFELESNLYF